LLEPRSSDSKGQIHRNGSNLRLDNERDPDFVAVDRMLLDFLSVIFENFQISVGILQQNRHFLLTFITIQLYYGPSFIGGMIVNCSSFLRLCNTFPVLLVC